MLLELYYTEDTYNTINKDLNLITSMNIDVFNKVNILTPEIILKLDNSFNNFNYAYIDEFERYYFITNIEPKNKYIHVLHLEVDVSETYKDDILNSKRMKYDNRVKPDIEIISSDTENTSNEISYVLSTMNERS